MMRQQPNQPRRQPDQAKYPGTQPLDSGEFGSSDSGSSDSGSESDIDRKRRLIDSFVLELSHVAHHFMWAVEHKLDANLLRGYLIEQGWAHPFCPITAVHYVRTGELVRSSRAHDGEVAGQHGWSGISLAITEASDERLDGQLGRRLMKAVGLKVRGDSRSEAA